MAKSDENVALTTDQKSTLYMSDTVLKLEKPCTKNTATGRILMRLVTRLTLGLQSKLT